MSDDPKVNSVQIEAAHDLLDRLGYGATAKVNFDVHSSQEERVQVLRERLALVATEEKAGTSD